MQILWKILKIRGIRTSTLSNRTKNGRIAKMKSNIFGRSLGDPKLYSKNSVLHDFQSILNPQNPRKFRFYEKVQNQIFYVFLAPAEVGGTGRRPFLIAGTNGRAPGPDA